MNKIYFITSNINKLSEIKAVLGQSNTFELVHYALEIPELQGSLDEIGINKCMTAATIMQAPVIVEDTALAFNSLNGLPGPYIKDFIAKIGTENLVRMLENFQNKSAQAISTVAYTKGPNQAIKLFTGIVNGTIVKPNPPTTLKNFDAIFQPDGHTITYAMMDKAQRYKTLPQYKSFMLLKEFLTNS